MWKWGCATVLAGVALTLSSCAMCGRAAYRAASVQELSRSPLTPGSARTVIQDVAAGSRRSRLALDVTLELASTLAEKPRERAEILQCELPVNYEVRDRDGAVVVTGAAAVTGSTIVPEQASPHYGSFDRRVKLHHRSAAFTPPRDGRVSVTVSVPDADRDGNAVHSAYAVIEEAPTGVAAWLGGGVTALFAGPVLVLCGALMFVIGLFTRRKAPPPTARA